MQPPNVGDTVAIYQRPLTQEQYEGEAVVVSVDDRDLYSRDLLGRPVYLYRLTVRFPDGAEVTRQLLRGRFEPSTGVWSAGPEV